MANGRKSKGSGVLAFIFLLPLVAIVFFAFKYSSQTIVINNVTKVTVAAPGEDKVSYDGEDDIEFFVGMLRSSLSINSAMRDVSGEKPVRIIFDREDRAIEYEFYPSLNLSGCLLVSPDKEYYVLENEKAKDLLLRPEFDYLYSAYFLPQLRVVSGEFVSVAKPSEVNWTYHKSNGEAYNYTPTEFATDNDVCTIYKGLENSLIFEKLPEEDMGPEITDITCVADNGNEYNIHEISSLNFSTDMMLTYSFTAKWSGRNGARAFGEAKYNIRIRYDIPATLEFMGNGGEEYTGKHTIGDVVAIQATHLNPEERVNFESILEIPRVEFGMISQEKGTGVALLPIGLSTAPGNHSVKLSCGGESISQNLIVSPIIGGNFKNVVVSANDYETRFSPNAVNTFHEFIGSVAENRPETNHFVFGESEFDKPVGVATVVEFGHTVNVAVIDGENTESGNRTVEGLIYEVGEMTNVRAVQAGEVVFSGVCEPTGNTVVLYHGYGVYSYYYHLSDISDIGVGRVYGKSETISYAGTLAEGSEQHVLNFAMSIDGVFVNPQWFLQD